MITCRLSHLEARCRDRGYRFDDVRSCIVSQHGDVITVDETHPDYPRPRMGLGDYIAEGLALLGITKPRVEALVGGPCGCDQRQKAANELGRKYLGIGRVDPPT